VTAAAGELRLDLPGGEAGVRCTVERSTRAAGCTELGVRFAPGQRRAIADLALALFSLAQRHAAEATVAALGAGEREDASASLASGERVASKVA
ncbi:MAG: hypothetical protein RMM28_09670, partial [Thermoleophilia bacterium]|nr:hypothetical protein [Thermoleophilia bacterium]